MATIKGDNKTKYDAGGTGDNIISDGYIKSNELVWIDTYTCAAVIPTTTSLCIGRIPKNRKLTDLKVFLPVLSAAGTTSTVYVCTGATTSLTTYFGALMFSGITSTITSTATMSTVSIDGTKVLQQLAADTDIYITIVPATTITGGTIRSIIRYV